MSYRQKLLSFSRRRESLTNYVVKNSPFFKGISEFTRGRYLFTKPKKHPVSLCEPPLYKRGIKPRLTISSKISFIGNMLKCDYLVIGAGKIGLDTARKLAKIGKKVILIEKENLGGTYLHNYEFPKKLLIEEASHFQTCLKIFRDDKVTYRPLTKHRKEITQRIANTVKKEKERLTQELEETKNLKVIFGRAEFSSSSMIEVNSNKERHLINFENCIITIGKNIIKKPEIDGIKKGDALTPENIYLFEEIPDRLAIIGLTKRNLELAHLYSNLGVKVEIFEKKTIKHCLLKLDKSILNYSLLNFLNKEGKINQNTEITKIKKTKKQVILTDKSKVNQKFTHVFVGTKKEFSGKELELRKVNVTWSKNGITAEKDGKTKAKNIFVLGESNRNTNPNNKVFFVENFLAKVEPKKKNIISYLHLDQLSQTTHPTKPFYKISSIRPVVGVGLSELDAVAKYGPTIKTEVLESNLYEGFAKFIFKDSNGEVVGAALAGDYAKKLEMLTIKALEKRIDIKSLVIFIKNYLG